MYVTGEMSHKWPEGIRRAYQSPCFCFHFYFLFRHFLLHLHDQRYTAPMQEMNHYRKQWAALLHLQLPVQWLDLDWPAIHLLQLGDQKLHHKKVVNQLVAAHHATFIIDSEKGFVNKLTYDRNRIKLPNNSTKSRLFSPPARPKVFNLENVRLNILC